MNHLHQLSAKLNDVINFGRGDRALRSGLGDIGREFGKHDSHQVGVALVLRKIANRRREAGVSASLLKNVQEVAGGIRERPASHQRAAVDWLREQKIQAFKR